MRRLIALLPLLFLWPALRHAVEGSMALHMLVQFPLLLAAGWMAGPHLPKRIEAIDAHGLLGLTAAICVAAFWMIPAALDLSLLSAAANLLKYLSWWAAGALLARSWPRLRIELLAFFLGNLAWMLATAGLLFREAESRLCVNYLANEQQWTGNGLIALALILLTLLALAIRRALPQAAWTAAAR